MAESQASSDRSQKYDEELVEFQTLNKENRRNALERMYREKYENRYDIYKMIKQEKMKSIVAKSRSPGGQEEEPTGEVNFMSLTPEQQF